MCFVDIFVSDQKCIILDTVSQTCHLCSLLPILLLNILLFTSINPDLSHFTVADVGGLNVGGKSPKLRFITFTLRIFLTSSNAKVKSAGISLMSVVINDASSETSRLESFDSR